MANNFAYGNSQDHIAWLAQVQEEALEPELPIIDPHHHLWMREPPPYFLREFVEDLYTGHRVVATVHAECHSMYRNSGPEEMRVIGESEFIAGMAAMSDSGEFGETQICKALIGQANLMLGHGVGAVFDAHEIASGGRFRGIRISAAWHKDTSLFRRHDEQHYLAEPKVREGIAVLQERDLVADVWVYHHQLSEVAELARAFENLKIVLNHTGMPVLGGPYKGRQDEVFEEWLAGMKQVAECPNVTIKLGALPLRKSQRENPDMPPTSDEIERIWGPWILPSIDLFGPERSMFESNFPVHKNWCSYPVLWNSLKRIVSSFTAAEKQAMFFDTANRIYNVGASHD